MPRPASGSITTRWQHRLPTSLEPRRTALDWKYKLLTSQLADACMGSLGPVACVLDHLIGLVDIATCTNILRIPHLQQIRRSSDNLLWHKAPTCGHSHHTSRCRIIYIRTVHLYLVLVMLVYNTSPYSFHGRLNRCQPCPQTHTHALSPNLTRSWGREYDPTSRLPSYTTRAPRTS